MVEAFTIPQAVVDRMIEEATELNFKMERLDAFIKTQAFKELHLLDRSLLLAQSASMQSYFNFLTMRIDRATA